VKITAEDKKLVRTIARNVSERFFRVLILSGILFCLIKLREYSFDDAKIYAKDGSMQDIVLNFLLIFVKVLLMREKFLSVLIFIMAFTMIKMR